MGRGRSERSDELVNAAYKILQEIQPLQRPGRLPKRDVHDLRRYGQGSFKLLNVEEVADILGVPKGYVYDPIRRARSAFRKSPLLLSSGGPIF